MTDGCVFEASAGQDFDGEKFTGKRAIGKSYLKTIFLSVPGCSLE